MTSCGLAQSGWAQTSTAEEELVIPVAERVPRQGKRVEVETTASGSSSRGQRAAAIQQIPLHLMSPSGRETVHSVLDSLSLYRRMPTIRVESRKEVYEFFTNHPDVAVSIWRAMNISKVQMWQTGPDEFETDTQQGTWGTVDVLLRSPGNYIITCSGQFQSPALPKPIRAVTLMHLQPQFEEGAVTHTLDLFVTFPSQTVETVAKLISPISYRIADRNFEEISLFMEMMSLAMTRQPGWVEQIAGRLDGILAGRSDELLKLTATVYIGAQKELSARRGEPISFEDIRPPIALAPEAAGE